MIDNEELRKKIIDSYDSQLKDIFTEDEVLAILDALKPPTLATTSPGFWPTITTNSKGVIDANDIIHAYNSVDNDMFKVHPESEPIYKVDPVISSAAVTDNQCEN